MTEQPLTDIAAELLSAIGLHQGGQLSQAQAIYEKILRLDPAHADALYLLGLIAADRRQFAAALDLIGRAIAASPANPTFYANRAIVLHDLKQLDAALADYDNAIALKPDYAEAYNNRGVALRELKRFDASVTDCSKAVAIRPDFFEAYNNRGIALQQLKRLDDAIADYDKAIALRPDHAEAYNNRGAAFQELKQYDAAMADYDKAIAIRPDYADAHYNRGNALREQKKSEAAIAAYDKAVALNPAYAAAYSNRGSARQELKQLDAAIADFDKAAQLKPDYAEAYYNRGNALREMGRPEAAIAAYDKAVAINPDYAAAYNNRGVALRQMGKRAAALADFDKAISLASDFASANLNKALALLVQGELRAGFDLYEWRWKVPGWNIKPRHFAQPLWLGQEPLRDKAILLHSEQGLGDTIQFCRYAPLLAEAGALVILEVPRQLPALLKDLEGVSRVLPEGEPLPDFDYHCPLLSLPLACKTVLGTIPDPTPYLHADPAKARHWQERIGARKKLLVGVIWSGGFRPQQIEAWGVNEKRNIRLDLFAHALSEVDADFFSLQKGDPAEAEIRGRESQYWPRGNFHNFAGDIKDFSDTAALMENLDLVVSVDTATAHLAAALGKPCWMLNRFDTDWRWLLDRDDSPWYRSVKLYRQDESESWEPVLARVAADLTQLAEKHRLAVRDVVR